MKEKVSENRILNKIIALILCLLILFPMCSDLAVFVFAANYSGVNKLTLEKNDGSYSEEVSVQVKYGGGLPMFHWDTVEDLDETTYETYAAAAIESLKNEYTLYVTMDWYEGGNTQTVDIVGAEYDFEQAKDSSGKNRWCLTFHFVLDPQHTVKWQDNTPTEVYLQVFGAEAAAAPDAPQRYENITQWRLVGANGSTIDSARGSSTITLPERVDFATEDEARAYADQLLERYPNFCTESNYNTWMDHNPAILTIEYDHTDVNGAYYKITTYDSYRWHGNFGGQTATFYIVQPDSNSPYENVTRWRLIGDDGSVLESTNGQNTIVLTERIDFESQAEARAYADELFAAYPQLSVQFNYNSWLAQNLDVVSIEFDHTANNGTIYKVNVSDNFKWHSDFGSGIITFYILVPDSSSPVDYRGVTQWRLVLKGKANAVVTANDDNSIYQLPNIIYGIDPDMTAYADVLLEMYDFQVSFDNNATYTTYDMKSIAYQSTGDGYYLIIPRDNFYWSWGNLLNPRVKVRTEADGAIVLRNCENWGLVGYDETTGIGKHLVINGYDFASQVEGREEAFGEYLEGLYRFLTVQQNETGGWRWTTTLITGIEYSAEKSAYFTNSIRKTVVYKVTVYDQFYGKDGTAAEFYIAFTGEAEFGDLDTITVPPKEPDGIRMNLFDYWINDADPYDENGNPYDRFNWDQQYDWQDYDQGINFGHALKFFNMGYSNEDRPWMKDNLGWWNHGTQDRAPNVTGIVKPTLSQRYPQLNLGTTDFVPKQDGNPVIHSGIDKAAMTESLAYLFDPTMRVNGKASFANVTGLFQRNSDGYYYYDSKLNFAQYDELYNTFILYNDWGVAADSSDSPNGQFFPFNDADDAYADASKNIDPATGKRTLYQYTSEDGITSRSERFNHFFGFTMEIDFQQPEGGQVNSALGDFAQDMVFKFAGDDDVWIFVDGVLVLDLGGVHSAIYGEINFATGEVITGLVDKTQKVGASIDPNENNQWVKTTLREIFEKANTGYGIENDGDAWQGNTFGYDTLHTIKIFYMERGHFDSNLAMYFNLQPRVPHKIYKVDEDGEPLAGATFAIYAAEPSSTYKSGETYHSESEFVPVNRDGSAATWETVEALNAELVTGTDGYVTLGGIDFANRADKGRIYYYLVETSPAPGYRVLPERLVLEFVADTENPQRGAFRVLNQYETGAYASFSAILENNEYDIEDNSYKLYYAIADLDEDGKLTIDVELDDDGNGKVIRDEHKDSAMLFAVPMIYTDIGYGEKWYPICGSNTDGFRAVDIYGEDEYYTHPDNTSGYTPSDAAGKLAALRWSLRHNLLAAVMRQVADSIAPDWYFQYSTVTDSEGNPIYSRYTGELLHLPGDRDRYLINSKEEVNINGADLRIVGLLVDAESMISLINANGGSVTMDEYERLSDEERYNLLQKTLKDRDFENTWDEIYFENDPDWSEVRRWIDDAYDENTEGTTRARGVNLAYIDGFTRYYGSVFYIPNERRELRALKEDAEGNPLPGATFGLFGTFEDAALGENMITWGVTGENGILIFSYEEDTSPANAGSGWALMDWDSYTDTDSTVWLKEISAPDGYKLNEAIVQIYVGERTIYANASAYRAVTGANGQITPQLIDDVSADDDVDGLRNTAGADGVTVWASVGKLFQSMEKFSDSLLNSTLLDIDGSTIFLMPRDLQVNPDTAAWQDGGDDLYRLHFWDRRVLGYTSSDYSTAHHRSRNGTVEGEVFAVTENGFLQMLPTQTPTDVFLSQHAGEGGMLQSRRDELFYASDGTPMDLYNIFSHVNVVVIRDEYEGDGDLRITKRVEGDAPEAENKLYTFIITATADVAGQTFDVEGAIETSVTFPGNEPYTVTVTVKGAGTAIIKNLPPGQYSVEEDLTDIEIEDYEHSLVYDPPDGTATVEEDKVASVIVTNRYDSTEVTPPDDETAGLSVTKTVRGSLGDRTKEFTFTVTLSDKSINGKYGDMDFVDGMTTFKLKHGQTLKAEGLPAGIEYTVTESDNEGYEVSSSGADGVLVSGGTSEAHFTNTRNLMIPTDSTGMLGWLIPLILLTISGVVFITVKRFGKVPMKKGRVIPLRRWFDTS